MTKGRLRMTKGEGFRMTGGKGTELRDEILRSLRSLRMTKDEGLAMTVG
jgi:hypothetical protein